MVPDVRSYNHVGTQVLEHLIMALQYPWSLNMEPWKRFKMLILFWKKIYNDYIYIHVKLSGCICVAS